MRALSLSSPRVSKSGGRSRHNIAFWFVFGLIWVLLYVLQVYVIEPSRAGRHILAATYSYLQSQLGDKTAPPIVVLNIADIPVVQDRSGAATSRAQLREVLDALKAHGPRAVGIDIDFSPVDGRWLLAKDGEFLDYCLGYPAPVYLGIHRTLDRSPAEWLGIAKYQKLAAAIAVPPEDTTALSRWIRVGGQSASCRSLAEALALTTDCEPPAPPLPAFMMRSAWTETKGASERREFLVDYGPIQAYENQAVKLYNPDHLFVPEDALCHVPTRGVFLLGDVGRGQARDTFMVPGQNRPFAGVLLHACALQTLLGRPLYEFTNVGRLLLDISATLVSLALSVVMGRLVHGLWGRARRGRRTAELWVHWIATALTVMVVFIAGIGFVHHVRVMWDGYFLAALMLVVHAAMEQLAPKREATS